MVLAAVSAWVLLVPLGCNLILGGGYVVGATDGSTGNDSSSSSGADTSVPMEAAADACPSNPMNKQALESACTTASCAPFDNATRNTGCAEGGTVCPAQPTADASAPETGAPVDSGAPDTGSGSTDAAAEAAPPPADAGISCFSLTTGPAGGALPPPILYATGSTAIQPYMARVAQVIESLGIGTVVYQGAGSCLGVSAMLSPTQYPLAAIAKTATYYDPQQSSGGTVQSATCVIDDPARTADLGISDVFPTTCDPQLAASGGLPSNLYDFFGPVQTMEMVVPITSMQTSISNEAAYMVWGFGASSGVAPWTNPAFLLQRSASSGTQNMIAATINLPAADWVDTPNASSGAVLTAIENVTKGLSVDGGAGPGNSSWGDQTIGILASDVADSNRMYLKPLAFQDVGQSCGWYPDSTPTSEDKANVRDGHYPIWGPSHLIAYADSNGNATNPAVKTLIDAMNGRNTQVNATLDVIGFYATSHILPTCAMHVQRSQDGHDYQPYAPPTSCSCYYDLRGDRADELPEVQQGLGLHQRAERRDDLRDSPSGSPRSASASRPGPCREGEKDEEPMTRARGLPASSLTASSPLPSARAARRPRRSGRHRLLAPAPRVDAVAQAGAHYARGVKLYEEDDFRAALIEFSRAYELAPNWAVLYNLGQAHYQLREYAIAMRTLERYVQRAAAGSPPTGAPRWTRRSTSWAGASRTSRWCRTTRAPMSRSTTLPSGRPRRRAPRHRRGSAQAGDQARLRAATKVVDIAGGDKLVVALDVTPEAPVVPPPPREAADYTLAVVSGGVAVAGIAVGTVFGLLAIDDKSSLNGECNAGKVAHRPPRATSTPSRATGRSPRWDLASARRASSRARTSSSTRRARTVDRAPALPPGRPRSRRGSAPARAASGGRSRRRRRSAAAAGSAAQRDRAGARLTRRSLEDDLGLALGAPDLEAGPDGDARAHAQAHERGIAIGLEAQDADLPRAPRR